jgi:tight adherence protein B
MIGLLLAVAGAYGVFLLYTAVAFGWSGVGIGPRVVRRRTAQPTRWRQWLVQAGLDEVRPAEFVTVMALLFLLGAGLAFVLFGGVVPAVLAGGFSATAPAASYRQRRARRLAEAREAWPRMIEEIRLLTGSLGRSVPQALLDVGRRGPVELRPAFAAAEREWLLSTDFARTTAVLKTRLADPTADAACETLLVAHEVGGSDVDRRLAALVEDRIQDLQGRKDAQAKQAGVRFARRFVLVVPLGMALAGLSIGTGRAAYQTALGQALVALGLAVVVACWVWAGRLLRLPEEERVFS